MNKELMKFDIENAELIDKDTSSRFAWAKIQAFSSGENKHNLICDEDTLKKTAHTIYNTPIMYEIRYGGDFGTHTENGKSMIAGFVVPDSAEFIRLEDGRLSLTILSRIWKMYAPKVMEIFKRGNNKSVSVEMELVQSESMKNGLTKMIDFIYTGIQLLGDAVIPASPDAHAVMISFSEAKKIYDEDVSLEFSKYKDIDFTIPEGIKRNSAEGLELSKVHGSSATCLAIGKFMAKNDAISPEKVRSAFKFLEKNKNKPKNKTNPDSAYISYMLHGGDEAYNWSKNLVEAMDKEDSENPVYFDDVPASKKEEKEEFSMEDDEKKVEEMATETPAEEKEEEKKEEGEGNSQESEKEETKEENKEGEKEEMSLDANLDVSACLAMLDNETEEYAQLSADFACGKMNYAKLCNSLYTKMCNMKAAMEQMSAENESYSKENMSLKDFKANAEAKEFSIEVERTLNEVLDVLPKEKIEEARENAKSFSLGDIDGWKNQTKAMAFSFVKNSKKEDGNLRIQLPHAKTEAAGNGSSWKR